MNNIIDFQLEDGSIVHVESASDEAGTGMTRVARGGPRDTKGAPGDEANIERFEAAIAQVRPAAQALLDSLKDLNTPDEIALEFGLKFGAKAGAIIASADSEAVFKVAIKWTNPKP